MKRLFQGMLAAGALALAAAPVAAAATGGVNRNSPVVAGSNYLALGDSVTFGYMESNVVPAPNYHDASNFFGYPEQFGPQLRVRVANASCPGETSSSLIDVKAISNGCENKLGKPPGYRTKYPLHVRYKNAQQSQLDYAVQYLKANRNTRLVSLMIGANDVFVCQETTKDGCLAPSEQNAVFNKIAANVRTILSTVRNKAGYRGQIAIVQYYSLNYTVSLYNAISNKLNQTMANAAKPYGVRIAQSYNLTKLAAQRWGAQGDTCKAGLLTLLSTGSCGVHPSYAESGLLAQALIRGIRL